MQCGQQIRPSDDRRDDESAVAPNLNDGTAGRDTTGGGHGRPLVAARRQPGGLAGRVDAADLHRHRCDSGQAQHEHHNQDGDAERRLHGGRTGIVGYALVFSARAMMFVSAVTIESPVTTA